MSGSVHHRICWRWQSWQIHGHRGSYCNGGCGNRLYLRLGCWGSNIGSNIVLDSCQPSLASLLQPFYNSKADGASVKDESLGLVSVSRLKVPRLSVSSRSRTKFWNLSRLGLVSDENFWDSLVPVSSRWLNFYLVSSRSRPDLDE